jgi:hypothetical protein
MAILFFGIVQVGLLAAAGPIADRADRPPVVQVRTVCDQTCDCWQTRYRERRPLLADRPDLACPPRPSDRPVVGDYNGHYRTGPAIGIGFDSRAPVRGFAFPF